MEILALIADELTNQEIADRLFISQRTVHSHRRNLMQKIGVKNTAGLVRYALEHKLLKRA
jgi:DNA-binding CsgD family transcriptional regulator